MKFIYKSYKYRIYPTEIQKEKLAKHFGCCRFIYNYFLEERIRQYEKDKKCDGLYAQAASLRKLKKLDDYSWLKEVGCCTLTHSLSNLDAAFKKFYRKERGFPRFKSKDHKQSFRAQSPSIKDGRFRTTKFREGIRMKMHKKLSGEFLFATISKSSTNKYYVSITCKEEFRPFVSTGKSVGIDTGLKELAVLSDGISYDNIKPLRNKIKKLKYEHKQLSKKKKGSRSRSRQKTKLALVYEKVTNVRKHYLHKVSTEIVKNHDIVSVEDLAVKNLVKNHNLSQAFNDVSLGLFYSMLEYKSHWNDRRFVKVDRFFPSSKKCHKCGWIKSDLTLSIRIWTCESCGEIHDRDVNAAKNILKEGLNKLSGCEVQSDLKQKQVESLSSDEAMNPEALAENKPQKATLSHERVILEQENECTHEQVYNY